jgi:RNA polymerase sigma factor (sigma-70 family)
VENFELVEQLKLELIREYEQYVETIAGLTDVSEDDAREALHRAACEMLVGLSKRPPGNPVIAWRPYIISGAIHKLRDEQKERKRARPFSQLRKDQREEVLAIRDPRPTPAEVLEKKDTAAILWSEVEGLSAREAEVLRRWAHDSSHDEIATALGIKASTVRKLWSRGIHHLRKRPKIQALAA